MGGRDYRFGKPYKLNGKWRCEARWVGPDGRMHKTSTYLKDEKGCYIKSDSTSTRGKRTAISSAMRWQEELVVKPPEDQNLAKLRSITLRDACQKHIDTCIAAGRISDNTRHTYESFVMEIPVQYQTKLAAAIGPRDIIAIDAELRNSLCQMRVRQIHAFISSSYNDLIDIDDLPISNPCKKVPTPKVERRQPNSLDLAGIRRLNSLLDEGGCQDVLVPSVKIALHTGMRLGEICALRFCDCDLAAKTIHVRHGITPEQGRCVLSTPKTASSVRDIPMDSELATLISVSRERAKAAAAAIDLPFSGEMYVLAAYRRKRAVPARIDRTVMDFWSPNTISVYWHDFAVKNAVVGSQGRLLHFHDLRHTYATIAVMSGVADIEAISHILGHKDASMTLDIYADALPDAKRSAAEKIGSIMSQRA